MGGYRLYSTFVLTFILDFLFLLICFYYFLLYVTNTKEVCSKFIPMDKPVLENSGLFQKYLGAIVVKLVDVYNHGI
jgi:hypothetical protein